MSLPGSPLLLAYTGTGVGECLFCVLKLAIVLIGRAVETTYRLIYARAISSLRFTKARVTNTGASPFCLAGVAVG